MSKEGDQRPSILESHKDPFEKLPSEGENAVRKFSPTLLEMCSRALRRIIKKITSIGDGNSVTVRRR